MTKMSKAQLRWGCRRGMLELDLILLPFFEKSFDQFTEDQQLDFQAFLSEADQDIYAWILDYQICDKVKYHALLQRIRQFANLSA